MRILNTIGEDFAPEAKEILAGLGEVNYKIPAQKEVGVIIDDYDVAVVGLGLNFHRDILMRAKKLKVIATATTGLDHIDVASAEKKGIKVLSLRGEDEFLDTITGTAELAFGLLIDLLRRTPWAFGDVRDYRWRREDWKGASLNGKVLGVVGLGRLGRMMARFGKSFGMNVLFTDPKVVGKDFPEYQKVSFNELLEQSDVISIHVHLNKETENLFGQEEFEKMKRTAILINTARGKIVNEKDLLAALKKKDIAGYGADVLADELSFDTEGFRNYPLVEYARTHDNCIITPHIGGMTYESREATDIFVAQKVVDYLKRLA